MKIDVIKIETSKPTVLIQFVLDESGSMAHQRYQVISGFNEYIEDHKHKTDANYLVSLTKFASESKVVYVAKPVHEVAPLATEDYYPSGGTALRDAIGKTIELTDERLLGWAGEKPKVLTFIFTDGQENASNLYSVATINQMITSREMGGEGNWTFTFIGASADCLKQAQSYGIYSGNTIVYNSMNMSGTVSAMSAATSTYTSGVTRGMSRTSSFFSDAGLKSAADIDSLGAQVTKSRLNNTPTSVTTPVPSQPGIIDTTTTNVDTAVKPSTTNGK